MPDEETAALWGFFIKLQFVGTPRTAMTNEAQNRLKDRKSMGKLHSWDIFGPYLKHILNQEG